MRVPRRPLRLVAAVATLAAVAVVAALVPGPHASARQLAAAQRASPAIALGGLGIGPPSAPLRVTGTGFLPGTLVEIFFDRSDLSNVRADEAGAFSIGIQVPLRAAPGTHWVTALDPAGPASAQRSFLVSATWLQGRGAESQRGFNPYENVLDDLDGSPRHVEHLVDGVRADTAGGIVGSAVFDAVGTAYVGTTDGTVAAFSSKCAVPPCSPAWTAAVGTAVTAAPSIGGSRVFAVSRDAAGHGIVTALPTSCHGTCSPSWSAQVSGLIVASPTVFGNRVYVSSRNGDLLAFTAAGCGVPTCAPVWTAHTGGPISAAPTVGANRVFVGSTNGTFSAFNAAGGGEAWHKDLGAPITEGAALGTSAQSEPLLYVGTRGDMVFALKSSTGATRWSTDVGADVVAPPSIAYDLVFVGTAGGTLSALRLWGCPSPCAPAWTRTIGAGPVGPPVAANGLVFAASEDGALQAYNARSGDQVWDVDLGGPTDAAPVVVNGTVAMGLDDGTLHVFRLDSPPQPPAKPLPADLVVPASPIRHVVVIFQENQSFDSVLGVLCTTDRVAGNPRCDGATSGKLPNNTTIQLQPGAKIVPGVKHSAYDQNLAINHGKMNGFARINGCEKDTGFACYQQYSPEQLPNLSALARSFTVSDRTFEGEAGPSWGAHFILASGNLDHFVNGTPAVNPDLPGPLTWGCDSNNLTQWVPPGTDTRLVVPSCVPKPDGSGPFRPSPVEWVPTIMDRMDGADLTWRLYSVYNWWSVCPTFADCLYDPQANNSLPSARAVTDAKQAALPSLSLVMPSWDNSQHNRSPMAMGDNWIASIVNAIQQGPEWESTAIFITYDDCGCFYDHVPPPAGMGIRVPMVIVSPYAKAGFTDSTVATFESMLAYTEHTFGVDPLAATDAGAYDFHDSFDYSQEPLPPVRLRQHPLDRWIERWLDRNDPKPDWT